MKRRLKTMLMGLLLPCGLCAQAKTVVNYPTVESKPYTGSEQTPTVPGSPDYDVISASSGTGVGGYDIYLVLTDAANTKWPDTDEEIGTMKWYITKAANAWTTEPSIESWTYGDPASTPVAAAKFGTPTVTFSGTAKDGTTYADVTSVAKAGNYTCKFVVAGTDNYEGLDPVVKDFEIKVAVPGGGGGGSGNVNISVTGYDGPYDGKDHQINVSITGDDAPTFSVGYSDAQEGPFQPDNSFKYKEIGTHTVWYRLQSVNYETVTNSAVVKISQREIMPPTIAPKEYNGGPQSADVTETADYSVEYNGTFTDAGTHENAVVLALKDSVHCKWADGAEDPVLLSFTITKSSGNVWLTEPSITGWKYGESAHVPVAVPKYGVVSVLYDGTTTDGAEIKDATAVSKAGSYTAKFTVPETTSYNGLSKNVTFEIERGKIDIGGGGGSGGAKLEVGNYTGTYDGDEHTASITVAGDDTSSFTLTYSLEEAGVYTPNKPTFSNACETTKIWYSVSSPDYQTITNYATVAIDKRKVTLASATDSKKYTGTALTAQSVAVSGDGWAGEEDATYDVTGSQTVVGTSKNTFTYTLKGGAKEQNYTINKVEGDLTVEKAKINDGNEPGSGFVPVGGVSKFDKTFEYDGKGHAIDTNEVTKAFDGVVGGDFEIHFMVDESGAAGVRALPPVATNVCVTSVWYKVSAANYEDFVHEVRLTITARDIAKATIAPIPDITYVDKPATPVPVVTDGTPSVITANDYTVSYLNNAKPGTATLTLTGRGNYKGTKPTTFEIVSPVGGKAVFDAFGGKIGGKSVVTQEVTDVYGALPDAARRGCRLDGWFLGVTNGAPRAVAGGAVLAKGDHTLFARWTYDPAVTPDPDTIYKWEAIDANTARILGFKDAAQKLSAMVLPDKIGGRFVTEIGASAFANSTCGATELALPMFCTKIGDKAFLNIPTITEIAFADTRSWENPEATALLAVGRYAFSGAKGLTSLSLGASVGSLGDYAFLNTRNLKSVTILGKPTVGTQAFRSSGLDAGGVTVHLDPALASDAAYMAALKANMYNVTVKTDAIVTGLKTASLSLAAPSVRLTVSVEKAADWGAVDVNAIRVKYRKGLSEPATVLVPTAATRNSDGSVTVEVVPPEAGCGFFQTVIKE